MNRNLIIVEVTCHHCNQSHYVEMSKSQYKRVVNGKENLLDILPNVDPEDREILVSGTCGNCWDMLLGIEC